MKKIGAFVVLAALLSGTAYPFIFKDLLAYAQRKAQILQHMGKWHDQLGKMDESLRRFQEYQREFDRYYGTFNRIYRRISRLSWHNYLTTAQGVYRDAMIFTELPRTLEDFDFLQATDYLTQNPLYQENEDYRAYIDGLLERHQQLVADLVILEEQLNSLRAMQQERLTRFGDYEQINEALSSGATGEASVTEQMGLQNQLILEQLRQQHELAAMLRLMLEKQLTAERERVDEMLRLGNLNRNRRANGDEILRRFGAGGE